MYIYFFPIATRQWLFYQACEVFILAKTHHFLYCAMVEFFVYLWKCYMKNFFHQIYHYTQHLTLELTYFFEDEKKMLMENRH